jgi:hypothetical protein
VANYVLRPTRDWHEVEVSPCAVARARRSVEIEASEEGRTAGDSRRAPDSHRRASVSGMARQRWWRASQAAPNLILRLPMAAKATNDPMKNGGKSRVEFRHVVAPETISAPEQQTAECILARLVALAYAAEHPGRFVPAAADMAEVLVVTTPSTNMVISMARDFVEKTE